MTLNLISYDNDWKDKIENNLLLYDFRSFYILQVHFTKRNVNYFSYIRSLKKKIDNLLLLKLVLNVTNYKCLLSIPVKLIFSIWVSNNYARIVPQFSRVVPSLFDYLMALVILPHKHFPGNHNCILFSWIQLKDATLHFPLRIHFCG